jgi:transposase
MHTKLGKKGKLEKPEVDKSIKFRLFPNKEQKATLNRWFLAACWVEAITNGCPKTKGALCPLCMNKSTWENNKKWKWLEETPYDIHNEAMSDVLKAYRSSNFESK